MSPATVPLPYICVPITSRSHRQSFTKRWLAAIWLEPGLWTTCLDSGGYVSLSGDRAEEMRLRSAAAAAAQIASTLEHLNSPRTSAQQIELPPSRRDSLNFTTATADRCPRGGGCLLKHKPAWSLYSVSSVWDVETWEWLMAIWQQWLDNRYFSL